MTAQQFSFYSLHRSWLRLTMLWLVIWLLTFALLATWFQDAWQWLLLSGAVLIYCLWVLRRRLSLNHRPQESDLFPTFGPGNHLSLFRGLVIGLLAGFLLLPEPPVPLAWIIALLYTAASIADWTDGYVARRADHVTVLGQRLDLEFDGLGVAVISLLAIHYGQLPLWFLAVAFARYLFLLGIWWRKRLGKPVYDLPPSVHRRVMAGMLMGMMTVVLWPIVPPQMAKLGGLVMAVPLLLGFTRDWLFTTGTLTGSESSYRYIQDKLYRLMALQLPLFWRLLLTFSMVMILLAAQPWYMPQAWVDLLHSWGIPLPALFGAVLSLTAVGAALMVLFGFAGRVGAILLLFPIGFDITTRGLVWSNGVALICAMCLALLGSGLFSLWKPEEGFILQRKGARSG